MLGYVTVGVSDMEKSAAFYDAVFSEIGAGRIMDYGTFIVWSTSMEACGYSILKPENGKACTAGNGTMFAISAPDIDTVKKVYDRAIAEGATCEGKPGHRGEEVSGFYAAYFRDFDGNKLNCFCMVGG